MPDYAADLPLWGLDWSNPPLPQDLLRDLAQWQDDFNATFEPEDGWPDVDTRDRWAHHAEGLVARLRAALPPGVELTVDLWPIDDEE